MAADEVRTDRKYTKDHEWAKQDGDAILVGITAFAVDQLGDITLVNIDVKVGDKVAAGKAFGTIESVKTLSDLFAPVSGEIVRVNGDLENAPETINDDCWESGWMVAIKPSASEFDSLLEPGAYTDVLKNAEH